MRHRAMKAIEAAGSREHRTMRVDRRQFLITASVAAGGLLLKCAVPSTEVSAADAPEGAKVVPLNAWLKVGTDDSVTIIVSQAEMGQGISTTLPAVIAEEMGADWSRVRLENSPADPAYRNPRINWQFTGNSESTTSFFDLMREMGASAREMLISAASDRLKAQVTEFRAEQSTVIHTASGRSLAFSELSAEAAKKTPPKNPKLKDQSEWKLLGRSLPREDTRAKLNGSAVFGIDFRLPNM